MNGQALRVGGYCPSGLFFTLWSGSAEGMALWVSCGDEANITSTNASSRNMPKEAGLYHGLAPKRFTTFTPGTLSEPESATANRAARHPSHSLNPSCSQKRLLAGERERSVLETNARRRTTFSPSTAIARRDGTATSLTNAKLWVASTICKIAATLRSSIATLTR